MRHFCISTYMDFISEDRNIKMSMIDSKNYPLWNLLNTPDVSCQLFIRIKNYFKNKNKKNQISKKMCLVRD